MKIKGIIDQLSITGNTLSNVSKKIGIGEKRLKSALHSAGFEYSNSHPKGWFYAGEGAPPLDSDIEEFFPLPKSAKKSESVRVDSQIQFTQEFTQDEMAALKEMIGQYMNEKQHQTKRDVLHERIMRLEKGDKVRKTIVISDKVGQRLDDFAASTRFNKSDLLEIAIIDLISRYE